MTVGISQRALLATPLSVVDLETTGFSPGPDKIVEIAVVRIEPGHAPAIALETLINPRRRMSGTEVHGITDQDVKDAPSFDDVGGDVVQSLSDSVLGSYNVYFDLRFLSAELLPLGVRSAPPHICLMYMRPMLDLGKRCTLSQACSQNGVNATGLHAAASDALAAAQLWQFYLTLLTQRGVRTFGDLSRLKKYKFNDSFDSDTFTHADAARLPHVQKLHPRGANGAPIAPRPESNVREYWEALVAALSDRHLSNEEFEELSAIRARLHLTDEQTRWMHGKIFAGILSEICSDQAVTVDEAEWLWTIAQSLRRLGWAPGDQATPSTVTPTRKGSEGFFARLFGT